ncbi:SDR family oxidoreductase [Actinomadura sp. 9N407]|uniref:SDR family oxidoreductase n=1 Tax=Actinomadura sp. 9N407 TaxID=3375154 RepID=UPI00378E05A0
MILVTGATGTVGRPVVAELVRAGHKVRALTRTPATADLPSEAEVASTADLPLDGITSIFVNPAVFWTGLDELLARAAGNGVRRIVLLSSLAAADSAPGNIIGEHHLEKERETEVEQITGRPGRTFAEWAADHAADFI